MTTNMSEEGGVKGNALLKRLSNKLHFESQSPVLGPRMQFAV